MANKFPLIVDVANTRIVELPSGDYIDLTGSGIANLAVANAQILGGSNGQFLRTDGAGNLSWSTVDSNNANYANYANVSNTANSVAVANVTGIGNIATINLSGNANTVLKGDGTWGVGGSSANIQQPAIEWTANSSGNGQTFIDANLATFSSANTYASVYVNGVLQRIADYTISGTTLTFPGYIAANAQVTVGALSGLKGDAGANGSSYSDSNVTSLLASFGSNSISTTGNITANTNGYTIGYRDVPQVVASNTTLALNDAGKHYFSNTAGNITLTIPTNATVAFPVGAAISIVVQAAGNVLVNAASGVTLYMAANSTAANRVVATYGMATLLKVGTDMWFINGTSVS